MKNSKFSVVDRSVGYPVRDIMTDDPLCWDANEATRADIIQQSGSMNLTYIPVKTSGRIDGIISRKDLEKGNDPSPLTVDWLISDSTPILEVVSLFASRPDRVFLILESDAVTGLVAPADLNQIPARASFYLLVAHFEAELAAFVRSTLGTADATYQQYLSTGRFEKIGTRRAEDEARDLQLDITRYLDLTDFTMIVEKDPRLYTQLGFPFSIEAAQSKSKLHDEIQKKLSVGTVRNPVSHIANELITSRKEIARINEICDNLIYFHKRIRDLRPPEQLELSS